MAEADITPEQFDEWVEMDGIVPFGDEKLAWVMAQGFAVIADRLKILAQSWGSSDLKDLQPKDFISWHKKPKRKPKREYTSPNQAAMMFRLAMGNRG